MNRQVISALSVGAVLLLAGWAFLMNGTGTKTPKPSENSDTVSSDDSASRMNVAEARRLELERKEKNQSAYTRAISTADSEACAEIENDAELSKDCTNNVLAALAGRKNDRSYCADISDTELKTRCSNEYYLFESKRSSDAEICEKIENDETLKYACQRNAKFAEIESASFSGTAETTCLTLTGADAEYCQNRVSNDSDIELADAAIKALDAWACAKIQLASLQTTCSDTVYVSLAVKKSDITLCAKVQDASKKASCTQALSQVSDAKAFQVALAANDAKACSALTNTEMRTKCLDTVALKTAISKKDPAECSKITSTEMKAQCDSALQSISGAKK